MSNFEDLIFLQDNLEKLLERVFNIGKENNLNFEIYINLYGSLEKLFISKGRLVKKAGNIQKDTLEKVLEIGYLKVNDTSFFTIYTENECFAILKIEGNIEAIHIKLILAILKNSFKLYFSTLKLEQKNFLLDNISEAVVVINSKYLIKDFNNSFLELIGYRYSPKELVNKSILEILYPIEELLTEKLNTVRKKLLVEEIIWDLFKLKIIPITTNVFGRERLINIALIFKYPKG